MPAPKIERPSHLLPVRTRARSHRLAAMAGKGQGSSQGPPTYLLSAPSVSPSASTEPEGRRTCAIFRAASTPFLRRQGLVHFLALLVSYGPILRKLHIRVQVHRNCTARNRSTHTAYH